MWLSPLPRTAPEVASSSSRTDVAMRIFTAWRELRRGPVRRLQADIYGSGPAALDPAQMDALECVASRVRWRMSDLADALHLDPSTVTRTIDRLSAAGYVERVPAKEDGRGVDVAATPAGRRHCARVTTGREAAMLAFLDEFSDGDAERLAMLMERLVDGVAKVAAERGAVERAASDPA
jgi:DNA-binding MarR family transcriptional regulator